MIRAALGLSILMIVATHAAADPANADKLAAAATDFFAKGQFKEAAQKFAQAYKEDPSRPELYCNIGISYHKAKELPRAHLLLSQCLTRTALEQSFVDLARAVLNQVEDTLRASGHTPVTITVTPPATAVVVEELGVETTFLGSRTVWLAFGTYHVSGTAEGHVTRRAEIVAKDQKPLTVELTLNRSGSDVVPPNPNPNPTPKPTDPVAPAGPSPSKVPAILASGATVIALGVAVFAFRKAHEAANDSEFAIDQQAFDDDKSSVSTWNTVMGVTGALAVVGAAASTLLWVKATRTTRVEVKPTGGGASLSLGGRF